MRKFMHNPQFRTRLEQLAKSKSHVESMLTFSLLALAVRLYIKLQNVPPSFITLTEFLLYLEGQHDDEKAELWKRVYRDGPNVAKARVALEGAILAKEDQQSLREKYQAFIDALSERSTLQAVSEKVYRDSGVRYAVETVPFEVAGRSPEPGGVWMHSSEPLRKIRAIAGLERKNAGLTGSVERVIELSTEDRPECSGVAASWCPVCGDCRCARRKDGELEDEDVPNDECPLHGFRSKHAERNPASEEREMLQALFIRALDQGQKPECRLCGAVWKQGDRTACKVPGSEYEHDWVMAVKFDG